MLQISKPRQHGKTWLSDYITGKDFSEIEKRVVVHDSLCSDFENASKLKGLAEFNRCYGDDLIGFSSIVCARPSKYLPQSKDTMNPSLIKQVTVEVTNSQRVEIESTKWFDAASTEPGQPGVFRVNAVEEYDDNDQECQRYSFFNGKVFGPIKQSAYQAYVERFGKSTLGHTITHFQGLKEQA